MNKYFNKIHSEFEDILLELSKSPMTSYADAYASAEQYSKEFSRKKSLTREEYRVVFDLCLEMVQDWFPDTSSY